jgi:hypothetical protein
VGERIERALFGVLRRLFTFHPLARTRIRAERQLPPR